MKQFLPLALVLTAFPGMSGSAEELTFSRIQAELEKHYPEYAVVEPKERVVERLASPGNYRQGVLVGDFNSDGVSDFAAILRRPVREDEKKELSDLKRERETGFQMAIACNGQRDDGFLCSELVEPEVRIVRGTLDYKAWEWPQGRIYINKGTRELCREKISSRKEAKSLSLVEPYGYCESLFYPVNGGEYKTCRFCYH